MKKFVQLAIKYYQATRLMRLPSCRFYPSCSDYMAQAIEAHGLLQGLYLGIGRLLRCHPFSQGGTDFVPPLSKLEFVAAIDTTCCNGFKNIERAI